MPNDALLVRTLVEVADTLVDDFDVFDLLTILSDRCYRSGHAIVDVELSAPDGRWPLFTGQAIDAGFRSVHSLPLRLRGRTIGALNMFRTDSGPLGADDVVAAQALADVATIAILQHQTVIDAQALNSQLSLALNSRNVIEQAKGKRQRRDGRRYRPGFERLRGHTRNHNLRLSDVARQIADGLMATSSLDALARSRPKPQVSRQEASAPRG